MSKLLQIPKVLSEAVNRRRTEKDKLFLHGKQKVEQRESH